jgi:hypothetical protein
MAIQQSSPVAHETAVGMLSQPAGGPDDCQVSPASEVEVIKYGILGGPPTNTSMQWDASPHEA